MTAPARAEPRRRRRAPASLYEPLDWILVRTPLLPVEAYAALADEPGAALADARVRAALAVGAGDLAGAVERGEVAPGARAAAKLQRYLIRMSTRPTPYGLFAGVGLATPAPGTDLALSGRDPRTRTRPDMAWLLSFVSALEERPEVRAELRFRANTAALVHGGRVFLAERAPTGDGAAGGAVSVRATGPVRRALELARSPCRWADLADALGQAFDAAPATVDALLCELWRQTLLLCDLRPPLTCASPARYVADRLRTVAAAREEAAALDALLERMAAWDRSSASERAAGHAALVDGARALHAGPDSTPLQTDAAAPLAGAGIAAVVAEEAARAAELLVRLSPSGAVSALAGYRRAFEEQYGLEREVPLLELLDPDAGLGPPSSHGWSSGADPERGARRDRLLWELAVEALRDRRREIELVPSVLEPLTVSDPPAEALPRSLDLAVFVLAGDVAQIDAGDFRLLVGPNLGGQAAGRNLGRFADLLGPGADRALAEAARADDGDGGERVVAELVYLPARGRSANVAIRPLVRDHEIAIGTSPSAAPERVIAPDELLVGVRDGRFHVRWAVTGAEVSVRAGHMLNSMQAPALCRFLEEVARDGRVHLSAFDWGSAARLPYLPRVRSGRVILEPARWRIDAAARDRELPCDAAEPFAAALDRWRTAWDVPGRVYLSVGDNRLLIDLEQASQAEQLRTELRKMAEGGAVVLQEPLPDLDSAWLPGPDGRHIAELVVPLALRERGDDPGVPAAAPQAESAPPASRLRPPGSEWLFLKLYSPRAVEEELIAGPVRSLGEFALAAGLAADWFFLRYSDPDPHLRVRFRGEPQTLLARLLPEVCSHAAELVDAGTCTRFSLDTYDRELERYGGEQATAVAEAVFGADSRAVADLLELAARSPASLDRTTVAVLSVDELLAGLGLGAAERLAWYREAVTSRHESGDEYRRRGDELRRLVGDPGAVDEPVRRVLASRRAALDPLAGQLRALAAEGRLGRPLTRALQELRAPALQSPARDRPAVRAADPGTPAAYTREPGARAAPPQVTNLRG